MRVVAIDGPAGAGKSTVARAVAERLGLPHLDTGAMYRAVAWAALRRDVAPDDDDGVARLAVALDVEVGEKVTVDGEDATAGIRGADVDRVVSAVAANPRVREELVRRQRAWAESRGGGVVEGRDIGTVVFPQASLKVFLTASDEERARRRHRDMAGVGYEAVAAELDRRDRLDSTRATAPTRAAEDAVVVDTTGRPPAEIVAEVVRLLEERR